MEQAQNPTEEPFDIDSVPREVKSLPLVEKKAPGKKPTPLGPPPPAPTSASDAYERLLSSIPEFANFGKLFKVCGYLLDLIHSNNFYYIFYPMSFHVHCL